MPSIPRPKLSRFPGRTLRRLQRDPIRLLREIADACGDIAQFNVGPQELVLVNHPDLIRDLLVTRHRSFNKSRVLQRTRVILGNGLLTSEGEEHRRQRRLAQPAFHRERIATYADAMVAITSHTCEEWRAGDTVDAHREMMRLTLAIVAKTLFDATLEDEQDEIGRSLTELIDLFPLLMNPLSPMLMRLPIPATLRFRRAVRRLDETIYRIIDERRGADGDRGDLLSMLLAAQDEEEGGGMTDLQLRDEVMTIFLAGHETTANALSWSLRLVAEHPEWTQRIRDECAVAGQRALTASDYPSLRVTQAVVTESMRLYPPAWAVSRLALEDVQIGEWTIPRDAVVVASQALMHRDPRYWADADQFLPGRFLGPPGDRPRLAYFPFGAGPRICIGENFAWMEAVLLLATMLRRWSFEPIGPRPPAHASITLRPATTVPLRLREA